MSTKFTVEVELGSLGTGPQYLAEMKRDGDTWRLRVDPNNFQHRDELHEIIAKHLSFAALQFLSSGPDREPARS